MAPITRIALLALERQGGPRTVLAAIPGGAASLAKAAGVSQARVSQVLRMNPVPREWAEMTAELIGCTVWEVYEQLGQRPQVSPLGPLFEDIQPERL